MEVKACKNCRKLFNYLGGPPICMACRDELEKKFQEVKEYIRENRNVTIREISEANEVSVKQLQQWIREERLEFTEDSPIQLNCETCGKKIRTGRLCEECKKSLASGLSNTVKKPEAAPEPPKKKKGDGNHMRFLH